MASSPLIWRICLTAEKTAIFKLNKMRFRLMQYKWYRKWKGGSYYLIYNWITLPFWSDKIITSCGGRAIKQEHYSKQK
jgi:hypothetical protein